jgi:hypothetical protein
MGIAALVAVAVAGCSVAGAEAPQDQPGDALPLQVLHGENGAWTALPVGRGAQLVLRAEHAYPTALETKCGPRYDIYFVVDFGAVTPETIAVDQVTAVFRSQIGHAIVPRKLDVWSNLTADKQIVDGRPRGNGESVRYEVKRDYALDPNDPIVVLELQSAGSVAPDELACRNVARFVFFAKGMPAAVP